MAPITFGPLIEGRLRFCYRLNRRFSEEDFAGFRPTPAVPQTE
jgi:hypothetical protein